MATTQSFYFCTLEEYYTGGLFLGPGNGVTDGSVLVIALFLVSGICGNDMYLHKIELTLGDSTQTVTAG